MNGTTLLLAVIGHLVGDYLLQNDWMALNKKKKDGLFPCCVHAWLWTLSVCAFTGWWNMGIISVLFLTHFVQDHTNIVLFWMTKINRQEKFAQPPCGPWSIIVVDNVWHIVTLWAVWRFIAQ